MRVIVKDLGLESRANHNLRYRKNGDLAHASLNDMPNVTHREMAML